MVFGEEPFPKGWSPDLSEVATFLKRELQDAQGQLVINRISGRLVEVSDAQLAIIYIQLWHQIPKPDQAILAKEQATWIKMREKAATEASLSEEGGSLSAYNYSAEFLKLTELRTKELQARMKPSAKKPTK